MDGDALHDGNQSVTINGHLKDEFEAESSRNSESDSGRTINFAAKNSSQRQPILPISNTSSEYCYPLHTLLFKRIDFNDISDALVEERKSAWRLWQDSIKDSYYKVRKNAERSIGETTFNELQLTRWDGKRSSSPFEQLSARSGIAHRSNHHALYQETAGAYNETGAYAAPAVSCSQGIEVRYSKKVNDIEAQLLKTSVLPYSVKTITAHDFRNGPMLTSDGALEATADEIDFQTFMPRPYYSRPNRNDPDYFDFDLQHSVNLYKRPEGKYVPRGIISDLVIKQDVKLIFKFKEKSDKICPSSDGNCFFINQIHQIWLLSAKTNWPQTWEEKLLRESSSKGDAPLSAYMFTKGDSDWRTAGTSYLSAALRTPSFWEYRFQSIGREVRERNPISVDSLARNKPVPNRFTEYRDPDFEDLSDFED